jgi:hypothetical protein
MSNRASFRPRGLTTATFLKNSQVCAHPTELQSMLKVPRRRKRRLAMLWLLPHTRRRTGGGLMRFTCADLANT